MVSGTNHGPNLGPALPFSGTVGATVAALRAGLPAIAFSTDPPVDDENDPAFAAHFENVAEFGTEVDFPLSAPQPQPWGVAGAHGLERQLSTSGA